MLHKFDMVLSLNFPVSAQIKIFIPPETSFSRVKDDLIVYLKNIFLRLKHLLQVLKLKTESILPANPEILDGVDDIMQLSYLSEPSVLHNLQYKYERDMIYVGIFFSFQFHYFICNYL